MDRSHNQKLIETSEKSHNHHDENENHDEKKCEAECGEFYRTEFQTTDGFCLSYLYCDKRKIDRCGCYEKDCKPVVLLIHDIGYNATYWLCLMEKLCAVANVFAIDLPGAGESDSTSTSNLTLTKLVQYSAELLDQVCANNIYIVGHGYGALVALNFSITYPDRVIKIVSASANPRPYPLPGSDWTYFYTPETQLLFSQLITPGVNIAPVACALTQLIDPNVCESKQILTNQYINAVDQYSLYNPILQNVDFRAAVSQVSVPVLLTSGTIDPLVPAGALDYLSTNITNSIISQFYNQGHNYPVLNKGLFNTLVFNFLFVKCDPCCAFLDLIPTPQKVIRICCPEKRPCIKPCVKVCDPNSDSTDPYVYTSGRNHSKSSSGENRIIIPCRYV